MISRKDGVLMALNNYDNLFKAAQTLAIMAVTKVEILHKLLYA